MESVAYTYQSTSSGHHADTGSSGDLIQVKRTWQVQGDIEDTQSGVSYTQYRYSSEGRLKGVWSDSTIKQMLADYTNVTAPDQLLEESDAFKDNATVSIEDHANKWITYSMNDDVTNSVDMSHWSAGTVNLQTYTGYSDRDNSRCV